MDPAFRLFLQYLKPHRTKLFLTVMSGFFKFSVPVVTAIVTGKIIEAITNSKLSTDQKFEQIVWMISIGASWLFLSPIFSYFRTHYAVTIIAATGKAMRNDLFFHLQKLSHRYFEKRQSGYLTSRVMADVGIVDGFIERVLIQSWMNLFLLITVLCYFFYQSWILALLTISMVPFQLVLLKKMADKIQSTSKEISETCAQMSGFTMENLSNIHVIKAFTLENNVMNRFNANTSQLEKQLVSRGKLSAYSQIIIQLIYNVSPLIVALAGSYLAVFHEGYLTAGVLVTFLMLQNKVYDPLSFFAESMVVVAESKAAIVRIHEILKSDVEIEEKEGLPCIDKVRGDIVFDNVSFGYEDDRKNIKSVSLRVPAKTTVAFVGPSGGGKSTITKLIPRFYDIQEGSIRIDGRDIKDFKIGDLRRCIGFVPQEPMLFSGTVYDNILYGNPRATKHDVEKAAKLANADEFIRKMTNGFQTIIGERGAQLSGGQKQRIAIARVFLKNPSILILDEATSALDNESEALIQKSLKDLMKDRTTIVIAHRLSTIRDADSIYVFEDGRLKEVGSHSHLVSKKGKYYDLVKVAG